MLSKIWKSSQKYGTIPISIGTKSLSAKVADSFAKRSLGLMHEKTLKKNNCMLFIFPFAQRYGIWMRNMLFPIDILWLDDEKKIVDYREKVQPAKGAFDFRTYFPKREARYVIELPAGFIRSSRVSASTKVKF